MLCHFGWKSGNCLKKSYTIKQWSKRQTESASIMQIRFSTRWLSRFSKFWIFNPKNFKNPFFRKKVSQNLYFSKLSQNRNICTSTTYFKYAHEISSQYLYICLTYGSWSDSNTWRLFLNLLFGGFFEKILTNKYDLCTPEIKRVYKHAFYFKKKQLQNLTWFDSKNYNVNTFAFDLTVTWHDLF